MNQMSKDFVEGLSDWKSIVSMTLGSAAYQLSKLAALRFLPSLGARGLALAVEVSVFRGSEAALRGQKINEAFETKACLATGLDFFLLKGAGKALENKGFLLTHAGQSFTMAAGHQLGASLHLVEQEEGTFVQRWMKAEVSNVQMRGGASLMSLATGHRLSRWEKSLEIKSQVLDAKPLILSSPKNPINASLSLIASGIDFSTDSSFQTLINWVNDHKMTSVGIVMLGILMYRYVAGTPDLQLRGIGFENTEYEEVLSAFEEKSQHLEPLTVMRKTSLGYKVHSHLAELESRGLLTSREDLKSEKGKVLTHYKLTQSGYILSNFFRTRNQLPVDAQKMGKREIGHLLALTYPHQRPYFRFDQDILNDLFNWGLIESSFLERKVPYKVSKKGQIIFAGLLLLDHLDPKTKKD